MSFTRQSILAIVIAIVASGQAQADWQSWISGQSLKNLGKSIASELGRVFYKAPKCLYENTSKSEKVVGACALFGTVGTGYYFYKKYQNACAAHRNCEANYTTLQKSYDNLKTSHRNYDTDYYNELSKIHLSCGVYYSKLTTDFIACYNDKTDKLEEQIARILDDKKSKPNSNNSPKSSPA